MIDKMDVLNEIESKAAKSIIDKGFNSAAEKLSFFMKEKITIEEVEEVEPKDFVNLKYKVNAHLLITDVVGELEGVCCLVFSEEEAKQFQNTALPKEITGDLAMFELMKDAILLEVDNIISASIITEFSNLLKRKMHGSVPQLKVVNNIEFEEFVNEHLRSKSHIINLKTVFISAEKSFSPMFICFLDQPFIDDIKAYARQLSV
jgi:chemotaxis protein CheY-P-specific phosphatase CheC